MTLSPQPESPEPLKVVAYLITGGRVWANAVVQKDTTAAQRIEERRDGSVSVPLVSLSDAIAAIQAARNEAEAMRADAERLANGWRLVPPTPTKEMVQAAANAPESDDPKQDIENMWSAMLDAVGPAETQEYRVSAGAATGWSPWFPGDGKQFEKSYQVERRLSASDEARLMAHVPCRVCGKLGSLHGSYPTCATHPYTPDENCRHVLGARCLGAECNTKGCVRAAMKGDAHA